MKKIAKLMIGIAIAAAAIIALGQGTEITENPPERCFSEPEIMFLMISNGWTQAKAEEVLSISCDHAILGH